ncbi:hypothetical protein HDU93_001137 [Gonapodya sp. JEL0774]|nr:hypothetical protein HDU93_001137 [Gonapodya sp. JEL0774]
MATSSSQPVTHYSLLVLGAGITGITAAIRFQRETAHLSPPPTVAVLEASHRVGGRLLNSNPDQLPEPPGPFDLGGAWVTGLTNNPLVAVMQEIGARFKSSPEQSSDPRGSPTIEREERSDYFSYPSFEPIDNVEYSRAEDRATLLLKRVRSEFGAPGRSLEQAVALLDAKLKEEAVANPEQEDYNSRIAAVDWLTLAAMKAATEPNDGLSFDQISSLEFEEIGSSPTGSEYATVEGGLASVVQRYADANKVDVRFGEDVCKVEYGIVQESQEATAGVRVTTRGGRIWTADHVICTFPHPVILSNRVTFEPPLPSPFISGLSSLNTGTLSKLILLFPSRFWGPSVGAIGLIPTTSSESPPDYPASFLDADALELATPYPPEYTGERFYALVAFCWGNVARVMETDLEGTVERAVTALRRCYGEDKVGRNEMDARGR